jgi:hypothetical protein
VRSAGAGTERQTTWEAAVDNPEPTEHEQELAQTERQQQEEDMRGPAQDDDLPIDDDQGDGD